MVLLESVANDFETRKLLALPQEEIVQKKFADRDMKKTRKIVILLSLCVVVMITQFYVITHSVKIEAANHYSKDETELAELYVITPTFKKPEQIPELVRLSQTLLLIPKLTWLVVEDGYEKNDRVEAVLKRKIGLNYRYLLAPMPEKYRNSSYAKPKGVSNRNKGLEWIRKYAQNGVLYFADDDNTYDVELFHEIRKTKTVSLFPVGLVTELGLSSPIVENCKFIDFYDGWIGGRKFPVDMAGFAVSVEFLLSRPNAKMPYTAGYEEDGFLRSLAPFEAKDAQMLASCCSEILVWHTRTVHTSPAKRNNLTYVYKNSNLPTLQELIV
ncbi:unnamed protein product [Diabrotica balteata]|uniref:Galactosylgalactosylxylosylprotein 3-beta-glucuronosyltransferase n=1 Tax=Diabrotica balteata TaxID=107213 RepID=A0A9N9SXJ6_DIABA|nr:unnamed protein product [Diabrotica balteata]